MKNFRKVLALVLVVATLLSFATFASADYKDQAAITTAYEPAVDVLTALGILQGEKSGDQMIFRPADEIDRDEVAKMVAVLHNGGDDIEKYYSDACTFADTKNTWAAGYVAYCYHTGIIAGRNATTFDPDASITGYEVAKMLLCTMGFDAEERGYVNNKDWKVNIMRDAKNFGLLADLNDSFNLKNNIKREEVAQMMFTVLDLPVVLGSISGNIVNITNAAWVEYNKNVGVKDVFVTDTMEKLQLKVDQINGKDDFLIYGNVVLHKGSSVGDLFGIFVYDVFDQYGRPYKRYETTWIELEEYVKGQKVEYYWFKDYPYAPISVSYSGADKFTAHHLFVNGKYEGAKSDYKAYKGFAGQGMILETYNLGNEFYDEFVVVALDTALGVVTDAGKWQGAPDYSVQVLSPIHKLAAKELSNLDNVSGLQEDDVVLINYFNGRVDEDQHYILEGDPIFYYRAKYDDLGYEMAATATKVEPEMIYVSRVASNGYRGNDGKDPDSWTVQNSKFYSGKDQFEYHYNTAGYFGNSATMHTGVEANCRNDKDGEDLEVITECYVGDTYAVYRANGYVIGWLAQDDLIDAEANWNYVVTNPDYHKDYYHVMVDGKLNVAKWYLDNVIDFSAQRNDALLTVGSYVDDDLLVEDGRLVRYEVNKFGEADNFQEADYVDLRDGAEDFMVDLSKGEIDGIRTVHLSRETKFLAKIGEKYEAATGYKEAAAKWGKYVISEDANIQYFTDAETGVATYVYMDIQMATEKGYFYIIDWVQTVADVELFAGEEAVVEQYAAIVDGQLVKLWINSDNFEEDGMAENIANGLYDRKAIYLTMTLEGEKIYYIDELDKLQIVTDAFMFDHVDDDKVWYKTGVGDQLQAHALADEYTVYVLDYAWVDYDDKYGFTADDFYAFKNMTVYSDADAFNAEFQNNKGYGMEYFAARDAEGFVTELYILRVAYHKDDLTPDELPWH